MYPRYMSQLFNLELMWVVIVLYIVWIRATVCVRMRLVRNCMRTIDAIRHIGLHVHACRLLHLTRCRMRYDVSCHDTRGHDTGHYHGLHPRQHKQCKYTAAKTTAAAKVTQECHGGKLNTVVISMDSDEPLIWGKECGHYGGHRQDANNQRKFHQYGPLQRTDCV